MSSTPVTYGHDTMYARAIRTKHPHKSALRVRRRRRALKFSPCTLHSVPTSREPCVAIRSNSRLPQSVVCIVEREVRVSSIEHFLDQGFEVLRGLTSHVIEDASCADFVSPRPQRAATKCHCLHTIAQRKPQHGVISAIIDNVILPLVQSRLMCETKRFTPILCYWVHIVLQIVWFPRRRQGPPFSDAFIFDDIKFPTTSFTRAPALRGVRP